MKKTTDNELRDLFAGAGAPAVPALDAAAIMDAVRAEAAARPVRRLEYAARDVPRWFGAVAASLAFLAAAGLLVRAVGQADREIGVAWVRSVEPAEFVQNVVMPPVGHGFFGGSEP